jgi:hypothetical protein
MSARIAIVGPACRLQQRDDPVLPIPSGRRSPSRQEFLDPLAVSLFERKLRVLVDRAPQRDHLVGPAIADCVFARAESSSSSLSSLALQRWPQIDRRALASARQR